jgi:hypothetical protein
MEIKYSTHSAANSCTESPTERSVRNLLEWSNASQSNSLDDRGTAVALLSAEFEFYSRMLGVNRIEGGKFYGKRFCSMAARSPVWFDRDSMAVRVSPLAMKRWRFTGATLLNQWCLSELFCDFGLSLLRIGESVLYYERCESDRRRAHRGHR